MAKRRLESESARLLRGPTAPLAASELQKLVKDAAASSNMEVRSERVLPASEREGLQEVPVEIVIAGSIRDTVGTLYRIEHAERLLAQSTSALRDAGPWFLVYPLYLRAILAVRRGSPDEAIGFVRQSLTRIRDLQDRFAFLPALIALAAAAVLKGDDAWGARILGARDDVAERTGITLVEPAVRDLRTHAEQEARARLGSERWARAYAEGRGLSIDALIRAIDRVVS